MNLNKINSLILNEYIAGRPVRCDGIDGRCVISIDGKTAYFLDERDLYFNKEKVFAPYNFSIIRDNAPKISDDNILRSTRDIYIGDKGETLTRMKGKHWDTFLDKSLIDAFDVCHLYQDNVCGMIAVTEYHCGEEILKGYVMPVRTGFEREQHYSDSPIVR